MMKAQNKIGIIAGDGDLPLLIASHSVKDHKTPYFVKIETNAHKNPLPYPHIHVSLGKIGSIIDYFRSHEITDIAFAGSISKPLLQDIVTDTVGQILIQKIIENQDTRTNSMLEIVEKFFINYGFNVLSIIDLLNIQSINTITTPTDREMLDIHFGFQVLESLSPLDIGQAVIIEHGVVLGIEAEEGTDQLIERCCVLRKSKIRSGVLVKTMKTGQNTKMDIPCIGVNTVRKLIEGNFAGVAVEHGKVIMIDIGEMVKIANQAQIFLHQKVQ